jgi:8-oxo-dGTP pyrophosphatase MutT (NUDIX family)
MIYKKRSGFNKVFDGTLVQVLQKVTERGDIHEIARRSPGVRMIILTPDNKFLIAREKRDYLEKQWDYRLPGGKVVDTLSGYLNLLQNLEQGQDNGLLDPTVESAVLKEAKEEVGITIRNPELIHISSSGGTIEWDLWYWLIKDFDRGEQELEHDEEIEILEMTPSEVIRLVIDKEFSEDRSRVVLMDYLIKNFPSEYIEAIKGN